MNQTKMNHYDVSDKFGCFGNRHAWTSSLIRLCRHLVKLTTQLWAALYSGWSSWWTGQPLTWFPDLRYQACATVKKEKKTRDADKYGPKLIKSGSSTANDTEVKVLLNLNGTLFYTSVMPHRGELKKGAYHFAEIQQSLLPQMTSISGI